MSLFQTTGAGAGAGATLVGVGENPKKNQAEGGARSQELCLRLSFEKGSIKPKVNEMPPCFMALRFFRTEWTIERGESKEKAIREKAQPKYPLLNSLNRMDPWMSLFQTTGTGATLVGVGENPTREKNQAEGGARSQELRLRLSFEKGSIKPKVNEMPSCFVALQVFSDGMEH